MQPTYYLPEYASKIYFKYYNANKSKYIIVDNVEDLDTYLSYCKHYNPHLVRGFVSHDNSYMTTLSLPKLCDIKQHTGFTDIQNNPIFHNDNIARCYSATIDELKKMVNDDKDIVITRLTDESMKQIYYRKSEVITMTDLQLVKFIKDYVSLVEEPTIMGYTRWVAEVDSNIKILNIENCDYEIEDKSIYTEYYRKSLEK